MNDLDLNARHSEGVHEHRARERSPRHDVGPKGPWDVVIDVYLNSVGPAPAFKPQFDIQTCLPTRHVRGDPRPQVLFFNDGRPGFNVTFRLFDNTNNDRGSGYHFAKNSVDAVWSKIGTDCPTGPVHEVFREATSDDPTTLVAFNPKQDPWLGEFHYSLNVSIDEKRPYVCLDPGGPQC